MSNIICFTCEIIHIDWTVCQHIDVLTLETVDFNDKPKYKVDKLACLKKDIL